MKFSGAKGWAAILLVLLFVSGCSKPEDKLVGRWLNDKTSNGIEFEKNHSGAIFQRTDPSMPPNIPFKWTMIDDHQFKVDVGAPGTANAPTAKGRVEGDTLTLENDKFTRVK